MCSSRAGSKCNSWSLLHCPTVAVPKRPTVPPFHLSEAVRAHTSATGRTRTQGTTEAGAGQADATDGWKELAASKRRANWTPTNPWAQGKARISWDQLGHLMSILFKTCLSSGVQWSSWQLSFTTLDLSWDIILASTRACWKLSMLEAPKKKVSSKLEKKTNNKELLKISKIAGVGSYSTKGGQIANNCHLSFRRFSFNCFFAKGFRQPFLKSS